ncbi:hypothetical protein BC831DRAFT_315654 [Entophlyctis helioformis]|nr:hypothetical protein BC831DRAFT_315654 [Entophlyctis helioformis]
MDGPAGGRFRARPFATGTETTIASGHSSIESSHMVDSVMVSDPLDLYFGASSVVFSASASASAAAAAASPAMQTADPHNGKSATSSSSAKSKSMLAFKSSVLSIGPKFASLSRAGSLRRKQLRLQNEQDRQHQPLQTDAPHDSLSTASTAPRSHQEAALHHQANQLGLDPSLGLIDALSIDYLNRDLPPIPQSKASMQDMRSVVESLHLQPLDTSVSAAALDSASDRLGKENARRQTSVARQQQQHSSSSSSSSPLMPCVPRWAAFRMHMMFTRSSTLSRFSRISSP